MGPECVGRSIVPATGRRTPRPDASALASLHASDSPDRGRRQTASEPARVDDSPDSVAVTPPPAPVSAPGDCGSAASFGPSCRTNRKYSSGTPGIAALRRSSISLVAPLNSSSLRRRAAHQAPSVLSSRNATMYGSVKSCVTAGSSSCSDLDLGAVDLVLLLGLPELIDPPERVRRNEYVRWQALNQFFQLQAVFARESDLKGGMCGPEHLRQHLMREMGGHRPFVETLVLPQILAVLQRDRDVSPLRRDQQVVLREKSCEQHPVPALVRTFVYQTIDRLSSGARVQPIAELTAVRTQPSAQAALLGTHVPVGLAEVHGERLQRCASASFRHIPRVRNGSFELPSQIR